VINPLFANPDRASDGVNTPATLNSVSAAITTDFFANLDAISGRDQWRMFGTSGDAKGQPTQTNAISHGSPWMLIRNIMVGAAFDG
jgi:hypothetical protein